MLRGQDDVLLYLCGVDIKHDGVNSTCLRSYISVDQAASLMKEGHNTFFDADAAKTGR